ncbi:MAG: hypothetical protein WCR58_01025 [Bacteroidales bacterium]|jgi:hypothetical protein|nr:hypothetical protein [Bacteroidales bacterium]MDD3700492.1 hypothetical protein [Bacteroidales bacterium]MDY0369858.1 hypothetical protein [Bacteroidales bacterium]
MTRFPYIILILMTAIQLPAQEKIRITPDMLYNFSTRGDATLLIDEFDLVGDPANGDFGLPETVFSAGWTDASVVYPVRVVIDLGVEYALSSLWLFDTNDSDSLFVYAGDPSGWALQSSILLDSYNQWREIEIDTIARMLMLLFPSPSSRIAELVLYGQPLGLAAPDPMPVIHQQPMMDVLMGVNGFVDDPSDKIRVAGGLREYHDWSWDEGNTDTTYVGYPDNQYAWNPSWVSGPGWGFNFDEFYTVLRNQGVIASPVLQGSAPYMTGFVDSLIQHKPIRNNRNPADPLSYIEHADYMFQFAARYGNTLVDASLLKLRPDQQKLSALGLIQYIENWNEPDKWWFGRGGYFAPDEFAAMCSADYDGHEGAMGPTKGMKTADPRMKMVMGGLASLNKEYIRCMWLWSKFNRQNGFPADVINLHHYSGNGLHGISPEEDRLKEKLAELVAYRNQYLPRKEIWLSEFGYDTNPESILAAKAIDSSDAFEVQGQWIMRSYLEAAAAGVDKALVFMLRDVNAPNPNVYNSSGLTGELWYGHQPKKSWYYVHTMRNILKHTRFSRVLPSSTDDIYQYLFEDQEKTKHILALWSGTAENRVIPDYQINLTQLFDQLGVSADTKHYRIRHITAIEGDTSGQSRDIIPVNDLFSLTVSERPSFLVIEKMHDASLHIRLKRFNSQEPPLTEEALSHFCVELNRSDTKQLIETKCFDNDSLVQIHELAVPALFSLRLYERNSSGLLGDSWLWNHWNGITALDALIIVYMAIHHPKTDHLTWLGKPPYTPVFQSVADINNSRHISAADALALMQRIVGHPEANLFPRNKHNFTLSASWTATIEGKTFPEAPAQLLHAHGEYIATNPVESVYYELPFEINEAGNHFLNLFVLPNGKLTETK